MFTDGFEDLAGWDATGDPDGLLTASTERPLSGTRSLKIPLGDTAWLSRVDADLGIEGRDYYLRFGLLLSTWSGLWNSQRGASSIVSFQLALGGVTDFVLAADGPSSGSLRIGSSNLGEVTAGQYLSVELRMQREAVSQINIVEAWIDGEGSGEVDLENGLIPNGVTLGTDGGNDGSSIVYIDRLTFQPDERLGPLVVDAPATQIVLPPPSTVPATVAGFLPDITEPPAGDQALQIASDSIEADTSQVDLIVAEATQERIGRSWDFDFEQVGFVRPNNTSNPLRTYGTETLKTWVEKALSTARGAHPIHPPGYGLPRPVDLIGGPVVAPPGDLEDRVRSTLTFHPRIANVVDFAVSFEPSDDILQVAFTVVTDQDEELPFVAALA